MGMSIAYRLDRSMCQESCLKVKCLNLDWSRLKACADDKINVPKILKLDLV